jgi:hypothetical protein
MYILKKKTFDNKDTIQFNLINRNIIYNNFFLYL